MRIFFIVTILVAVLVGWTAGGHPSKPGGTAVAIRAEAPPVDAQTRAIAGTVELKRSWQGHFTSGGYANDAPLTFMIDTGATQVVLSRSDAERAGVHVLDGDFDGEARTASATVRVARVRLKRVRIGEIQIADVPAFVIDVPDAMPLLGQSFLARVDRVSIEGDRMTLTKR